MVSAVLLVAFGVTAGTWGATALAHARWTTSAPRLAIAAWQALALSVLTSLTAAGAALAIGFDHVRQDLAGLLDLCAETLAHGYASPARALVASAGLTVVALLVTRTAWCVVQVFRQDTVERRARVAMVDLVGRDDVLPGVVVLDHDTPFAFCVGGRRHRVVVTRGLVASLDETELGAVLAHEAAHLRQRHHVALMLCRSVFGTLVPFFPGFRAAMHSVRLYAELSADDCARKQVGARPLQSALLRLACLPAPSGALAASAHHVETRLVRLMDREPALPRHQAVLVGLTIATLVSLPLAMVAAPALAMAWEGMCLIR